MTPNTEFPSDTGREPVIGQPVGIIENVGNLFAANQVSQKTRPLAQRAAIVDSTAFAPVELVAERKVDPLGLDPLRLERISQLIPERRGGTLQKQNFGHAEANAA
ncbi:hypothetical protein [Rhizobium populisoli]|uniref:hypothetical protein n=1 Tax=Rhizobium populisoli TaxID=2859785 RepID=UPI001FE7EA3E|nr:hypothetical protein [Rhizobium populisoli]